MFKDLLYLQQLGIENDRKCKYIFMFPQNYSA